MDGQEFNGSKIPNISIPAYWARSTDANQNDDELPQFLYIQYISSGSICIPIQSSSTTPERLDLVHPQTLNANLYTITLGQTPSEKKHPENIQESAKQREKTKKDMIGRETSDNEKKKKLPGLVLSDIW